MGLAPHEITVPNIYKYLNKGMELDPNDARAHYTNALTAVWTGYEWAKGEQEFLKVIEMNHNDSYARAYYAHLLLFLKRDAEALKQADKALELDPLNFLIQGLAAVVYWHAGNYEKAMEEANKVLAIVPNHPLGLNVLWGSHDYFGNHEEAVKYCGMMFGMNEEIMMGVQETLKTQGYQAALKQILFAIQSIPEEEIPVSASIRIAWLQMYVGGINEALTIIEEVLAQQGPDLPYVFTSSEIYRELQNNPRYLAVQEKMGLPPVTNK
jgi:tetratricopeptide (TPR) repeat protein